MNKFKARENFIKKSSLKHNFKYLYNKVIYVDSKKKVIIICPEHGEFQQRPTNHTRGQGCPKCAIKYKRDPIKTTDDFKREAIKKHGNRFNYDKTIYTRGKNKVIITCPEHGDFEQVAYYHLDNFGGCKECHSSKKEIEVKDFLMKKGIYYEYQKTFENCKNERNLFYDFYIPNNNLLIEVDGLQHYKKIEYFGGEEGLKATQKRDKIKNNFAKENNIKLLRIKYNDDVEQVLSEII